MKIKCKKIICIVLVLLTLFNFIYPSRSYATEEEAVDDGISAKEVLGGAIDGVAGILLMPAKLILLVVGAGANALTSEIAELGADKSESRWVLTLDDIFFHNVDGVIPIIDVNFFKPISNSSNHKIIYEIRDNVATWYYAIRNLAIVISLLVLVYIGIRMAISTLAEDKAKYKNMLTDWIVGFVTIFLLHYIIIATININEALVKAIRPSTASGQYGGVINRYMTAIFTDAIGTLSFVDGMSGAVVYLGMTVMTFMFLYTYMKRMITVAFLIIIAPIITVTYSIDKIGDRKTSSIKHMVKRVYI